MGIVELRARVRLIGNQAVVAGLTAMEHGFNTLRGQIAGATATAAAFGKTLLGLPTSLVEIAGLLRGVGLAGVAAFAGLGFLSYRAATGLDSIVRGLSTVAKSSEDLQGQLSRLQEIAKLPGLSFEQAASGSLALQSVGLSASLSERALQAFGNALASVGKGSGELGGVITALSQIVSKGVVSAEEINQIAERVPQIRALLSQAFGTADTEKIQKLGLTAEVAVEKLIAAAESLPKVSGGIGSMMENLADRFQRAIVPLGRGLAKAFEASMPFIEKFLDGLQKRLTALGEAITALSKAGVLADVVTKLTSGLRDFFSLSPARLILNLSGVLSFIVNLGEAINTLGYALYGMLYTVAENIRQTLMSALSVVTHIGDVAKNIVAGLMGQTIIKDPAEIVKPRFQPFAPFPDIMGILMKDQSSFALRALMAYRKDSMLGDITQFGGRDKDNESKPNGTPNTIDDYLSKIEKNTRNTVEELGLRRRSTGGGELGRLGVTAAEIGAFGSANTAGSMAPPFSPESALGKAITSLVRQEMARKTGTRSRSGG